jgi:DNA-binding IclR family transcriptional regulator
MKSPPKYFVPALEKGLDILECLAIRRVPMTQIQLAHELGRGQGEIFRMLSCLEHRGYLQRDPRSAAYSLTLRLFELSHTHSPFDQLLTAAVEPMHKLTAEVQESCHLGVMHEHRLLILAQEVSSEAIRLSVEVGGTFPLLRTVSGRVLLAFLPKADLELAWRQVPGMKELSLSKQRALKNQLQKIRRRGYEEAGGETKAGIYDLSVLVGSESGSIRAALTIAALTSETRRTRELLLPPMLACARKIGQGAGLSVAESG